MPELHPPEEVVVLTVDADGTPRAIGDLTESLPPKSAGMLRAVEYTSVSDALAEARARVDLLDRHYDVVREALGRLKPIIRAVQRGDMAFDELLDTVDHIRAMRPEDREVAGHGALGREVARAAAETRSWPPAFQPHRPSGEGDHGA